MIEEHAAKDIEDQHPKDSDDGKKDKSETLNDNKAKKSAKSFKKENSQRKQSLDD